MYEIPENMKDAVNALRAALGDNPLLITENSGNYFFADWDLLKAIESTIPHLPDEDEDQDMIPHRPGLQG